MALIANTTNVVNNDRSFGLGTATPGSPATGMIRWNTSLTRFEVYNGTAWVAMITTGGPTQPLWASGINTSGEIGDGTTTLRSSPVSVVGGFTDWVQVSRGSGSTAAIRLNGTLWNWGSQRGDGTTSNRSSPVSVVGGFTDWTQVNAGFAHTLGIRRSGTAWAWGSNGQGRLGDGTVTDRSSPVSVVGGFTDWVQVSAGLTHSQGIRANGTAWGWGRNATGRIGDGTTSSRSSPVSVVGGFTDWAQIAAGENHSAAIRANGTAWGWGYNNRGQIGDGTTTSRISPASVVGGFTDWIGIAAGNHTAAIRANGTAWAWGGNEYGQLGDGTTSSRSSPVSVVGGFTDWVQVSCGRNTVFAIRASGTAWAWGLNGGRLGDGTGTNRSSPVSVVGGFSDWVSLGGGESGFAAIRAI